MPYVAMRDAQYIHVRVFGRGQPVLLLPGFGMKSSHWLPFILPFSHRFRFYMPDFRGAGPSSAARLNQTDVFQNNMEDVQDVIAHFGLKDFLLAGYSLGGSTALHLLHAGGFTRVRRYLHIDQTPCIGHREDWPYGLAGVHQENLFASLQQFDSVLREQAHVENFSELPLTARQQAVQTLLAALEYMGGKAHTKLLLMTAAQQKWLLPLLLPMNRLHDIRAYLASYLKGGHDYRESLRGCKTPITVFVGMRSALYHPAGQMAIADYAGDVQVVRFEKSGHMPLLAEPVKFTRELGRFLHQA